MTDAPKKTRWRRWLLVLGIAVLLLPLLMFIPWRRDTILLPSGTILVIDAATKRPLAGVDVVVYRYRLGPPPRITTHVYRRRTSTDGAVSFDAALGRETILPLMMHGVPQWAFLVCAQKPGYRVARKRWVVRIPGHAAADDARSAPRLRIELLRGAGKCPLREAFLP